LVGRIKKINDSYVSERKGKGRYDYLRDISYVINALNRNIIFDFVVLCGSIKYYVQQREGIPLALGFDNI
ncbi:MAG: hypothetical protein ACRD8W_29390, partial [Nitrososphaeraceae archaeon]